MIAKRREVWRSRFLEEEVTVARWGEAGRPVLLFPTAGGDAEEIERFGMIAALAPLLASGRVQVFSCDSVPGRCWLADSASPARCSWLQNRFDEFVSAELAAWIDHVAGLGRAGAVVAGASLGAFHALASLCRHPDLFGEAICLSGKYDLTPFLEGQPMSLDFYYSSPLHFLPRCEDDRLPRLRRRFVRLVTGRGPWEKPHYAAEVAALLAATGVPHALDDWGPAWDHDWPSWRRALPRYVAALAAAT